MTAGEKEQRPLPIDAYLLTRGIQNPHQLYRSGGPGYRTMQRIYRGEELREDTIDRLADLLLLTPRALRVILDATRAEVIARKKKTGKRR
jgi:hypothetical protein